MNGASKILTVSYGTFSCTLEGFDEPFNTMKAIAEYFRDLAADDRYFGAEPPTPDAAMLHRIAEREIQRRVEAKINENGVILRTGDAMTMPVVATAPTVAVAAVAAPTVMAPPTVAPVPDEYHTPDIAAAPESVAAKLSRIRNAVAQQAATSVLDAAVVVAPSSAQDYAEDQHASDAVSAKYDAFVSDFLAEDAALVTTFIDGPAVNARPVDTAPLDAGPLKPAPLDTPALDMASDELASDELASDELAPDELASNELAANEPADDAGAVDRAAMDADEDDADLAALDAAASADLDWDLPTAEADGDLGDLAALDTAPAAVQTALPDDLAATLARIADEDEDDDFAPEMSPADDLPEGLAAALADEYDDELYALAPAPDSPEDNLADTLASALAFARADANDASTERAKPQASPENEAIDAAYEDDLAEPADTPVAAQDTTDADLADWDYSDLGQPDRDEAVVDDAAMADFAASDTAAEPASVAAENAPPMVAEAVVQTDASPAAMEKLQRARARVIKIRRAAQPDEAQPAAAEDVTDSAAEPARITPNRVLPTRVVSARNQAAEPTAEKPADAPAATVLSADAEADLQRELADLEMDGGTPAQEVAQHIDPVPVETGTGRPFALESDETAEFQKRIDPQTDDAVERLLEHAKTEMEVPENKRRLSAISHLKAAVAATVADRFGGSEAGAKQSRLNRYRDDLARVVRPMQKDTSDTAQDEPAPRIEPVTAPVARNDTRNLPMPERKVERPAPLVLVSAQRIDLPAATMPQHIHPVRPRRVGAAGGLAMQTIEEDDDLDDDDEAFITDTRGFMEFADKLGATSLADLLEAAAAYSAIVEGRPSFSRPQLLRHLAAATPDRDLSREDGLRGFGTLLRDGRIEKLRRGQFALTESSRYLTEGRKIAG